MAKPLPQRFEGFSCLFSCWKPFVGLAGTRMARIDPLNGLTGESFGANLVIACFPERL